MCIGKGCKTDFFGNLISQVRANLCQIESGYNKWTNVEVRIGQRTILDEIMIWLFSILRAFV